MSEKINRNKPRGLTKIFSYIVRFCQLGFIFLPTILMLPLAFFEKTQPIWIRMFVWAISKAGVVWIKIFQHMSHRGDIIGSDLAEALEVLRSFAPQHPYSSTIKTFKRVYGVAP
jgi:predicted unusual protein kinase regulating ubiquinone biosynthesis (AarF/ABC1/UbiB family)